MWFILKMLPCSESTEMEAVHMSIRSPGEPIHFLTLSWKSRVDLRDRSPR